MLIVISDSDFKPGEAAIVNELFRSGLDLFHVRKYGANEKELSDLIREIDPEHREKLVLNQHREWGEKMELKRFHYSEKDRMDWEQHNWEGLDSGCAYSTSVHTMEEYNALPAHFSYAFLSPVFNSISKPGYQAASFDFSKKEQSPVKLIGLGGIQADNAAIALQMGFDGIALLGAVWNSTDPIQSFRSIRSGFFLGLKSKVENILPSINAIEK